MPDFDLRSYAAGDADYARRNLTNKYALLTAKAISWLFNPFYLPTVAVTLLLMFSYLNQIDLRYRLAFGSIVVLFTWVFPLTAIYLYRTLNGWTSHQMSHRERRFVPYIVNIVCYGALYGLMKIFGIPNFISTVIVSALLIQIVCASSLLFLILTRISTMPDFDLRSYAAGDADYARRNLTNKYALLTAKAISWLFNPFYLPTVAVTLLLMFSYLNQIDLRYRLAFGSIVVLFTWVFPLTAIYLYRTLNGWTSHQMSHRERRFVPYIVNIVCYGALYGLMKIFGIPNFISTVIVSALLIQIVCALTNVWIKISTHAAASGGVIGMLMAFSLIFGFDATGWLCCAILLSGAVCSSRMVLKMHNYHELLFGVLVGMICGWAVVWFV